MEGTIKTLNIEPNFSEEIINDKFESYINYVDQIKLMKCPNRTPEPQYEKLEILQRISGGKPNETLVQEKYKEFLKSGWMMKQEFYKLQKITGMKISKESNDDVFNFYVKKGDLNSLSIITGIGDTLPTVSEEAAQEGYLSCLSKNQINNIKELQKRIWIKPKFSKKVIDENYMGYVTHNEGDKSELLDDLEELIDITKVKLNRNIIQKGYDNFLTKIILIK